MNRPERKALCRARLAESLEHVLYDNGDLEYAGCFVFNVLHQFAAVYSATDSPAKPTDPTVPKAS